MKKKDEKPKTTLMYLKRVKIMGIVGILTFIILFIMDIHNFENKWYSYFTFFVDFLLLAFSIYFIVKSEQLKNMELKNITKKK